MATKRMLVDAIHPEETRIVVTAGNRLEEFDFESATRRQLRGNIYLAKVTRVEPSLQAAFVEYGGNRHGFLAFSEIHPDYYQIPVADREALLRDEEHEDDHGEDTDESISLPSGVTEPDADADPQEPGDAEEIANFCSLTYDVSFPLMAKIDVNGDDADPIFKHLKKEKTGLLGSAIKWNFTKFLVDRDGKVVSRHAPTTKPDQLRREIEELLG